MKKIFRGDYFYFSKSDRVAAFILLLIIVFVNILRVMIDRPYPVELVSGTDSLFITTDTVKEKRHYTEKQRNTYSVRKKEPSYSKSTRTNTIKKDTSFVKSVESKKDTATIGFHVYRKKQIPVSAVDLNSLDSAALTLLPAQVLGTMLAPISALAYILQQVVENNGAPVAAAEPAAE